ncbi:MAG: hypothetical protein ACYC8T_38565 [Myxococcaceae bacterium]
MLAEAPAGAHCPNHPEVAATWSCGRCGSFMCVQCERRTRPDATPMCPACWELRAKKVLPQKAESGTRLQTAGLVLGCISLLPIWFIQLVSLVVNIIAIVKAKAPPARDVRWRPITGLVLTLVGIAMMVVLFSGILFAAAGD